MKHFTSESLSTIIPWLEAELTKHSEVSFSVLNPDLTPSYYAGEIFTCKETTYVARSYKAWMELAENLHCRMLTPIPSYEGTVMLRFQKLSTDSFHQTVQDKKEKYGVDSTFYRLHKMEEPSFYQTFRQALHVANIETKERILNLGVNRGDEFLAIKEALHVNTFTCKECIGVDHSASAIKEAQQSFKDDANIRFIEGDINALETLKLGVFDCIISIGTLQSPGINFKERLMMLVQKMLTKDGVMILGFPNCRWVDGEMVQGAKMKNYTESDLSLLIKDIYFAKKYLQQHKFSIRIFGKHYIFLVACR